MRSRNQYLYSNWSQPVLLNISEGIVVTSDNPTGGMFHTEHRLGCISLQLMTRSLYHCCMTYTYVWGALSLIRVCLYSLCWLLVPGSDGGLPVFAYVLFGVTGVLLLAALVIPITVCCHRSCFHRRIKLVSPWKCSDPVEYVCHINRYA